MSDINRIVGENIQTDIPQESVRRPELPSQPTSFAGVRGLRGRSAPVASRGRDDRKRTSNQPGSSALLQWRCGAAASFGATTGMPTSTLHAAVGSLAASGQQRARQARRLAPKADMATTEPLALRGACAKSDPRTQCNSSQLVCAFCARTYGRVSGSQPQSFEATQYRTTHPE